MAGFRLDIPPHVAEVIRHLPPDLKRSVKHALRSLSLHPFSGETLLRELEGLWKYRVRRFRIVYDVTRDKRIIRIFAVGHRQEVYEKLAERLQRGRPIERAKSKPVRRRK
ncbi:MAG: type II toxin-antitoxin system RelE family toxin [Candidatus Binatia bacterium]